MFSVFHHCYLLCLTMWITIYFPCFFCSGSSYSKLDFLPHNFFELYSFLLLVAWWRWTAPKKWQKYRIRFYGLYIDPRVRHYELHFPFVCFWPSFFFTPLAVSHLLFMIPPDSFGLLFVPFMCEWHKLFVNMRCSRCYSPKMKRKKKKKKHKPWISKAKAKQKS